MYENLNVQVRGGFRTDIGYFLQSKFTGKHNTLCAHVIKFTGGGIVYDTGLGGDMYFHIRGIALYHHQQTYVRNDKSVNISFLSLSYELLKPWYLVISGQGIAGKVHFLALSVGGFHCFYKLWKVEVHR